MSVMIVSGSLLFFAIPVRTYQNIFFRAKVVMLILAAFFAGAIYSARPLYDADRAPYQLGVLLNHLTEPGDLLITECGGSPNVLYAADRRGWLMFREYSEERLEHLRQAGARYYADAFLADRDERRSLHEGTFTELRLDDQLAVLGELTSHPVRSQYKLPDEPDVLPPADAMLVAPASSNTIAKWALGISDNLALGLITEAIGLRLPLAALAHLSAAQAAHPAFAGHLKTLRAAGVTVLTGTPYDPAQDLAFGLLERGLPAAR
jgi:hypothetical protein